MIKIAMMSDNHGFDYHVNQVLEREKDADFFFHCGDNEGEDENLSRFAAVTGNNDYWSELPAFIRVQVGELWFGIIHGNQFGYFDREAHMLEFMEERELDVLCFGHTHVPFYKEIDGKVLINPGSTLLPRGGNPATYCVVYVNGKELSHEFKLIDQD